MQCIGCVRLWGGLPSTCQFELHALQSVKEFVCALRVSEYFLLLPGLMIATVKVQWYQWRQTCRAATKNAGLLSPKSMACAGSV
jgi:hypothetical protein